MRRGPRPHPSAEGRRLRRRILRAHLSGCDGCTALASGDRRKPLGRAAGFAPFGLLDGLFRLFGASGAGATAVVAGGGSVVAGGALLKTATAAAVFTAGLGVADVAGGPDQRASAAASTEVAAVVPAAVAPARVQRASSVAATAPATTRVSTRTQATAPQVSEAVETTKQQDVAPEPDATAPRGGHQRREPRDSGQRSQPERPGAPQADTHREREHRSAGTYEPRSGSPQQQPQPQTQQQQQHSPPVRP